MNGALTKMALMVGLFAMAGVGFFSHKAEAEPDHKTPRLLRDIEHAVSTGDLEELEAILKNRPDLANISTYGGPPLHIAARYNQPAIIKYLLSHGADPNGRGALNGVKHCNALHWACLWGSKDAAQALIEEGFSIEDRNDLFKSTPLHWAALGSWEMLSPEQKGDHAGVARLLIEHGAAVNTFDDRGRSAISIAADDVAKVLAEHGASKAEKATPSTKPARDGMS